MTPARQLSTRLIALAAAVTLGLLWVSNAQAQAIDPEGRPISTVRYTGLESVQPEYVNQSVRTKPGRPYRAQSVREDIVRLTFTGKFELIDVKVEPNADGSINVIYQFTEQPTLLKLGFAGNERLDEQELEDLIQLEVGDQIDQALIERGARDIELAYANKGNFAASVVYDKKALEEKRELVYTITEGPAVRVTEIRFEGNTVFDDEHLYSQISAEEQWWPIFSGYLDRTELDQDVESLRQYYRDRGYLDAQVGRRIELSPRQTRAIVTFKINEGQKKVVRDVKVRFFGSELTELDRASTDDQLMSAEQIRYVVSLVRGGVFTEQRMEQSQEAVRYWYGEIGFINTQVQINSVFDPQSPEVDVVVDIYEGSGPTLVDDVPIIGLTRTQQKVLLRRVRGLEPGRPVNLRGLDETRDLVAQSIWFANGTITPLGDPAEPWRAFLIEANEKNTGTFRIGAGVSSDSGIFGTVSLEQRNFDIADWPESLDEFLSQRAFLGAGQTFNITLSPGNDNSNYSLAFREPYLFETDYFFDFGLSAFESEREDFDEARNSLRTGIGRRLGDVWTGTARVRFEQVDISSIEPSAPVDVFAVNGESSLSSVAFSLIRSTTDSNIDPGRGSRLRLGIEQFGGLGGDYDFTRMTAGFDQFWTLNRDFLGRKTILSFKVDAGYIPQDNADVPVFERFYAGGRGFRGFGFRGVGPRGIRNDTMLLGNDPVGGRWQFITRAQYEFPVYDDIVRWAIFTDQGTLQDDFGFGQWRASVGTGVRLSFGFFSQAPIAIDFALPLLEEDGDDTQFISFSFELPFN